MSDSLIRTGVVFDSRYMEHAPDSFHVESPERLKTIYELFDEPGFKDNLIKVEPRPAKKEELLWNHTRELIDRIEATSGKPPFHFDPDTYTCERSYDAALLAVGGVFSIIDAIFDKRVSNGFAFVRPPGHHAEANRAMGFCLFNNIALGAHYIIKRYGAKKILIVDWDIHHGNGTQHSFYNRSDVLYFSTHQSHYYPGTGNFNETGVGEGEGYTVNVPLWGRQGDDDYIAIFNKVLRPVALEYKPEFILVSAGFDIYHEDPLGTMQVTEKGFSSLTRILMDIASTCCERRLVLVLEGGYSLKGQKESVRAVMNELTGKSILDKNFNADKEGEQIQNTIAVVRDIHKKYWTCFM